MSKKTIGSHANGGFFEKAITDAARFPICPYGPVEDFFAYRNGNYAATKYLLRKLYEYLTWREKHADSTDPASGNPLFVVRFIQSLGRDDREKERFLRKRLDIFESWITKSELIRHPLTKSVYTKRNIVLFLSSFCPQNKIKEISFKKDYKLVIVEDNPVKSTQALWNSMNGEEGAVYPAEIGYLSGMISNVLNSTVRRRDYTAHSSLVYGIRCQNEKQQFLVRNTWGGISLKAQRSGVSSDTADYIEKSELLNGDFWISEALLRDTFLFKGGGVTLVQRAKVRRTKGTKSAKSEKITESAEIKELAKINN